MIVVTRTVIKIRACEEFAVLHKCRNIEPRNLKIYSTRPGSDCQLMSPKSSYKAL